MPAAPPALLPRVMAAVHAWTLRPWYQRAWFTWPPVLQAVSVAALVVLVAGTLVVEPRLQDAIPGVNAVRASRMAGAVASLISNADATVAAARILWRTLAAPLVPYLFALVLVMCLACAAFGTALNHAAFGRT